MTATPRETAEPSAPAEPGRGLDLLCINTIRTLAMDAVQKAESGHPGAPMGLAPLAFVLFTRHMRHNPMDPKWPNRDRFVLSNGHASMLLYASLFLTGYDISLDDIEHFRQWDSKTPGHPEHGVTPGVETTTGPLGQGFGNAVGMAVAEAHLAATFNREGHGIVDHRTWFICSDGDLMEGISHEAASFAGHFKLGKLIGFYDDNHITIDGNTDITFTDDVEQRFNAYGWHVERVSDVNDLDALDRAIASARAETGRPSLVICRTHIGYGSPNRQDSPKAHGEALGREEVLLTRKNLGWPWMEPFVVPDEVLAFCRQARDRGEAWQDEWRRQLIAYARAFPNEAKELGRRLQGDLPAGWQSAIPTFTSENGNVATRASSSIVLNALAVKIPELIGGSADLAASNLTAIKDAPRFTPDHYDGRNFEFGIREHGMAAMMNGMALHGGIIPYGGTFLIFSDYMRPSVRLACLMGAHVIYVYTHDSIGLGEDGPTHQSIEQLSSLRAIPGMTLIRPGDANEVGEAWRVAISHKAGPVALVLTRQKVPYIDRSLPGRGAASGVARGGYVVSEAEGGTPQIVLMASGSEVGIIMDAQARLQKDLGVAARVVSMASHELFLAQSADYRRSVLPPGVPRISIEAAHPMSWQRFTGDHGVAIGLERFGASAPYQKIYLELGLTVDRVVSEATSLLEV